MVEWKISLQPLDSLDLVSHRIASHRIVKGLVTGVHVQTPVRRMELPSWSNVMCYFDWLILNYARLSPLITFIIDRGLKQLPTPCSTLATAGQFSTRSASTKSKPLPDSRIVRSVVTVQSTP